jgi:hypothetical protein
MFKVKKYSQILRNYQSILAAQYHTNGEQKVIAIRREDQSVWERRAPLGIMSQLLFLCSVNIL